MRAFTLLSTLLVPACGVLAGYDASANNNVVMYWGQNSAGHGSGNGSEAQALQKPLENYCQDNSTDMIIVAFMLQLNDGTGKVALNLANMGYNCTNGLHGECADIGRNITACQEKGKPVLLSLGGSAGQDVGAFTNAEAAAANAEKIWTMFGPVTNSSAVRPFGDAVIDGFDMDLERLTGSGITNMKSWATEMRKILDDDTKTTNKSHYLTAAPQCPLPTSTTTNELTPILDSVKLDMVFVQFYNNPQCALNTTTSTANEWAKWAADNSTKFFIGLPASSTAVTNGGYLEVSEMSKYVSETKGNESFGGVMLWDASQAWNNSNYHIAVKDALA